MQWQRRSSVRTYNTVKPYAVLIFCLWLSACNNDSSSTVTTHLVSRNFTDNTLIQLDNTQHINQSVELMLYYPNEEISNILWQQTSGEPVNILSNKSKVIAFTPSQAGEYSFNVSFTINDVLEKSLEKKISVTSQYNKLTTRLSHVVAAENKVSLRAQLASDLNIEHISWQQIDGPEVELTLDDEAKGSDGELAIFFDAPSVTLDTIVAFKATIEADNGDSYEDQVAVLIEPAAKITNNAYFSDRTASVFVYNENSPYADNLIPCSYSNNLTSSCTLAKVPLLAEEVKNSTNILSIESIMDRVIVSHQWMGERFKAFLTDHDVNDDMKNLLRATTAIVISYDIRPSFYWAATGAIYLDPENFWLTPDERDTINEAPDYRSDFGNDLQFLMPWRYVKNNSYISKSYSYSTRVTRTPDDILYRFSALLYHELAHANDFFPSSEWYTHNQNKRVLDAATSSNFESDALATALPLTSQTMRDLAQVSFAGETASLTQKSYLPTDIKEFFSQDSATDFYAYSSIREDYAMLFEELLMQSRFGVLRDIAITNQPIGDYIYASDYIVTWGQRGRIGEENIKDRVVFSASRVLPEFDSIEAMNITPFPEQMISGDNWIENLTLTEAEPTTLNSLKSINLNSLNTVETGIEAAIEINEGVVLSEAEPKVNNLPYFHKPLPSH